MAIFVSSHNLCFIHNPKTGGSSIQKWLLENTDCTHWKLHCTLDQAKEKFPNIKYSFAVVRNPWDWAVSSYFYEYKKIEHNLALIKDKPYLINTNKDKYNVKLQYQKKNFLDNGFEYWLTNGHIAPQSKFLEVDYVLKFESLANDFKKIQDLLHIDTPLPHINKTRRDNYKKYYNENTINYVYNKYIEEIKTFGYQYETP
mgnify:FL=1